MRIHVKYRVIGIDRRTPGPDRRLENWRSPHTARAFSAADIPRTYFLERILGVLSGVVIVAVRIV